jgi:predicted RNA binding protein YcfA (HicA-like mRNA interferase family)
MDKLPVMSGDDVVRVLTRLGFRRARQSGSHVSMVRDDPFAATTVPMHKEVAKGTLRSIIRTSGLTVPQFIDAHKSR